MGKTCVLRRLWDLVAENKRQNEKIEIVDNTGVIPPEQLRIIVTRLRR